MAFKLSSRSLGRLDGVDEKLSNVVKKAIGYSTVDFGVIQGLRSVEEQKGAISDRTVACPVSAPFSGII